MREPSSKNGRLRASLFSAWLIAATVILASTTEGSGQIVAVGVLAVCTLAGLLRSDWREALAVGLAGAALTAWLVGGESSNAAPLLAAGAAALTSILAAWTQVQPHASIESAPLGDRPARPAAPGTRLPPGVADDALFERLAVHEMTRARRYERPLVLLLIGVDGWSTLVAQRGRRGAGDLLATLATRVRGLLRDVDAIGLHGDGRLAVLLPETPLDGALVVAGRIQQTTLEEVGVKTRVGAALFPDDAGTVETLLREAEAGLDLARLAGVSIVERVRLA